MDGAIACSRNTSILAHCLRHVAWKTSLYDRRTDNNKPVSDGEFGTLGCVKRNLFACQLHNTVIMLHRLLHVVL